ncbi:hypothetical protein FJTKL_01553 [Diaporthe vaccinii]|uniref:HNH nuclease domain-containing protein n=1 Tax=Diaporthe vaccinii TaxID=105482 RepID=A0ABR4E037_9PEZI
MADTSNGSTYNREFDKVYLSRALEDIRGLDEATQRMLLRAWPFPLRLPHCNLSGVDSAVVVLRRIFAELPADSHCRRFVFAKEDKNTYRAQGEELAYIQGEHINIYRAQGEELDRFRALFRYAWHYLPDLAQCDPSNTLVPLEVMDRQRSLLNVLLPDRRVDQSRISFEALMESGCMQTAFWGRAEFQPFRDLTGWQDKGTADWQTKQRDATPGPITWKRDQEPDLEAKINNMLCLRAVGGGNTSMLLPNWPTCLRVKMTTATPMTMGAMMEQQCLKLEGFGLLAVPGDDGKYRLARSENRYYLAAAVAMRSSPQGSDVVVTGSGRGMETCPLADDSHLGRAAHQEPDDGDIMVKEGMLYYVPFPPHEDTDDVSMSDNGQSEEEAQLTDDQKSREGLKAFDRSPDNGLTPLSMEAEEALAKNIAPESALAEEKFFG